MTLTVKPSLDRKDLFTQWYRIDGRHGGENSCLEYIKFNTRYYFLRDLQLQNLIV
jgi:hypothetical protein